MKMSDAKSQPKLEKVRLYLTSLLGMQEISAAGDNKKVTVPFHYAEIIEAQSLELAKKRACERAAEIWPDSLGWISRSITIEPIRPSAIQRWFEMWELGFLAKEINPPELGTEVNCADRDADSNNVQVETDKPTF